VDGGYTITGQVKNSGAKTSYSVEVSGTLYDASGVPVGCEHTPPVNLTPNQTRDFSISYPIYWREYDDVAYYRLRVAGDLP
jgi:hypothetical protein